MTNQESISSPQQCKIRRDLTAQKFGRLNIVSRAPDRGRHAYWQYRCDCGGEGQVSHTALLHRGQIGCGCMVAEAAAENGRRSATHGQTVGGKWTRTYRCYRAMLARCCYPSQRYWKDYGGRGISVCDRWKFGDGGLSGFDCFALDMGPQGECQTLDRIDVDGNYEPSNCRWVTQKQQMRNTRASKLTEGQVSGIRSAYDQGQRQVAIAKQFGISQSHVSDIVRGASW